MASEEAAAAAAPVVPVVVRKFPAPCWSQDETLALINSYQDKWFSLRRRNLRTADWEAVADEVNRRCPNQSLPKTSAQCRHKMEKLRKRYRTEKQRISNLPPPIHHNRNTRLFPASSWVFFDLMDSMEVGSTAPPPPGSNLINVHNPNPNPSHYPPPSKHNLNMNDNGNVVVKEEEKQQQVMMMRGKEDLGKYFDDILMSVGKGPIKFKLNNNATATATAHNDHNNNRYFDDDDDDDNDATAFDSNPRNFASASASRFNHTGSHNNKRKMNTSGSGGGAFVNGCSFKKTKRGGGASAVGDMVASINMLGDGLLKMEKMKMELMQDLQRQRMQMDLHNTKVILDSQHSILTAFLHGFSKLKSSSKSPPYPTS